MICQVDKGVWRGPRPTDYDAIRREFLSVISLEGLQEDAKEKIALNTVLVMSEPITFDEIYIRGITQVYLNAILQQVMIVPKPVYVHCQHGEDRTGLVIAAYRVRQCGWTKEHAMEEARGHGYRWWLNFGLNRTWAAFS